MFRKPVVLLSMGWMALGYLPVASHASELKPSGPERTSINVCNSWRYEFDVRGYVCSSPIRQTVVDPLEIMKLERIIRDLEARIDQLEDRLDALEP